MINEVDIKGLVGIPYCEPRQMGDPLRACDCYALVRIAAGRAGQALPVDAAELLEGAVAVELPMDSLPAVLDLVEIHGDIGAHAGIIVRVLGPEAYVLHQTKYGSRVDRFSVLCRAGVVVRRGRLKAMMREAKS